MTKKFSDARKMLLKACDDYIQHNQHEIDRLKADCPKDLSYPADTYFFLVIEKEEPDPGLNDWIRCQYYYLLQCILITFDLERNPFNYFDHIDYPFEEMKWWSIYDEGIDHTAPETILHNLKAMFNVLGFHMERKFTPIAQKQIEMNYHENDLSAISSKPFSIQIYKTLENFKLRAHFVESIIDKNFRTSYIRSLCNVLEKTTPMYEGYVKGLAVKELQAILNNSNLNDKEAIKQVEDQLSDGITIELLTKNRQSKHERDLKLLSIISICIGVGIFTTLGLVFKRLYDSGGTSINFFKPLSQNLYETIASVTNDIEEDEPSSSPKLL